ncbi:MAG TPA: hypothetical protein VHU81_09200 [Thermoanaerobaculia bacterium]|nr:hypothetical protein [Thermoanaerobaculia bacterium]
MSPRKSKLDEEIAALYAAPLESFITERNALASRLKKEKDREGSDEVKALRKPTPSAWAVNQLFQQEPARMDELLGAGERARKALHEAITSGGAESLRGAIQEARGLIEELRQRALEFLSEEGRSANPAMGERIGTNLQSLTFTPAAAETARRGWLDADLDPPGFEVLAGLQVAAGAARPRPTQPARPVKEAPPIRPHRAPAEERPAPQEARVHRVEKPKAPSLREREETRLREWREREEARQKAEREREEARLLEKVESATSAAESAAAEAAALQEEAERAAEAAAEARKKAERAQDKADRAAEVVARAREALEEARRGARVLAHPGAGGRRR